ncbi:MAG: hypothetical protein JNM76_18280 [Betaproteobacteria bacterium]|nr:hypothetical protein [Betaproteobacteria bacterium]
MNTPMTRYTLMLTGETLPARDRAAGAAGLARMLRVTEGEAEALSAGSASMSDRKLDKSHPLRDEAAPQ